MGAGETEYKNRHYRDGKTVIRTTEWRKGWKGRQMWSKRGERI